MSEDKKDIEKSLKLNNFETSWKIVKEVQIGGTWVF